MSEPRVLTRLFGDLVPRREWLTLKQLKLHGQFPSVEAARAFVKRYMRESIGRRGRVIVVDRATFDQCVIARGQATRERKRA